MKSSYFRFAGAPAGLMLVILAGPASAQTPAATLPGPGRGGFQPRPPAYPATRSTDPAAVERGRGLYMTTFGCGGCHASDIRGSDKGVSLLNSVALMEDANGELIATATRTKKVHGGRFNAITEAQFSDLAQFMKSIRNIGTGNVEIILPAVFEAGNPEEGRQYFAANCAGCHAVTPGQASPAANLAGIGQGTAMSGNAALDLQQRWLAPSTKQPTTAVVTLENGEKIEGRATRFTEFVLHLTLADGSTRIIERNGDVPKIEMTYPLAGHATLLRSITDKQIHDVTGYLVSLK